MAKILEQISTPLQLAALVLLLLAMSARYALRSGKVQLSPALTRLLVNRGFTLALVALVLGLLTPTLLTLVTPAPDETFYGAVRSTAGGPVAGATVELLTITSTPTNSLGQFDLVVPRNRVEKEYRVQVSAPGYKTSDVLVRTPAQMRSLEVQLDPVPRELVREMERPLLLGQFFGLPFAIVTLRVENPSPTIVVINDIRATLTGPGVNYGLSPVAWTIAGQWGPYAPIDGPLPIFAGAQLDLRVMLALPSNLNQLYAQMATLPEYRSQRPCVAMPGAQVASLSDAGLDITRRFATARFSWRPGEWRLLLDVANGDHVRHFETTATLTDADVATLRNSIELARECIGINLGAPLAQDGPLANFVIK